MLRYSIVLYRNLNSPDLLTLTNSVTLLCTLLPIYTVYQFDTPNDFNYLAPKIVGIGIASLVDRSSNLTRRETWAR